MQQVPTKEEYRRKLEDFKEEGVRLLRGKYADELNTDQRDNVEALAAITAAQTFQSRLDEYVDRIRRPANAAVREFLEAYKPIRSGR